MELKLQYCNRSSDFIAGHNSDQKKSPLLLSIAQMVMTDMKMRAQPLPIAPKRLPMATTPVDITATSRLFGLNIGDWSLMVIGLAMTGLLLLMLVSFR